MSNEKNIETIEKSIEEIKLPENLEKIYDPRIQRMLVLDYFIKNKSLTYLSNTYNIPIYDLKFYFYTSEAQSIYKRLKEELKEYPEENSLKYVREIVVDKLEALVSNSNGKEAADIIEKIVPQIIMLHAAISKTEGAKKSLFSPIDNIQEIPFEEIEDDATVMHDLDSIEVNIKTETPDVLDSPEFLKDK